MENQNKSMQQNGNLMDRAYRNLVNSVAASLYAITEVSDEPDDSGFEHHYLWFLRYMLKYDGNPHGGDCTQMPYACDQCIIDEQREDAALLINKEAFYKYLIDEELCVVSGI